jgi:hypothetical protein
LITSPNAQGCSIGRSPGFAPFEDPVDDSGDAIGEPKRPACWRFRLRDRPLLPLRNFGGGLKRGVVCGELRSDAHPKRECGVDSEDGAVTHSQQARVPDLLITA